MENSNDCTSFLGMSPGTIKVQARVNPEALVKEIRDNKSLTNEGISVAIRALSEYQQYPFVYGKVLANFASHEDPVIRSEVIHAYAYYNQPTLLEKSLTTEQDPALIRMINMLLSECQSVCISS